MRMQLMQTEGNWTLSTAGCYISVDNNLIDVITPLNCLNEENRLDLPNRGVLRLIIRDMGKNEGCLASASVSLQMLLGYTQVWLPLSEDIENDLVVLPNTEVKGPRVLVFVENPLIDDEIFLTDAEMQPDSISDIVLANEIVISNEPEEAFVKTSHFSMSAELNDIRKSSEVIDILNNEIELYKDNLEKEKTTKQLLQKKMENFITALQGQTERALIRENYLLDLLNEREKEVSKCLETNRNLVFDNKKLEIENKNLNETIKYLEEELNLRQGFEREMNYYKEMLEKAEANSEKLVSIVIELGNEGMCEAPAIDEHDKVEKTEYKVTEESAGLNADMKRLEKGFETMQSVFSNGEVIERVNEFLYKVNDIEYHLAFTEEGVFVKSGLNLFDLKDFIKKKKKPEIRRSEVPYLGRNSINGIEKEYGKNSLQLGEKEYPVNKALFGLDKELEVCSKKYPIRGSPTKMVLKSYNMSSKYKSALSKPILKDSKSPEKKKPQVVLKPNY